jgi:catechol 2,3-dioxygenase-like lactoylglutathione lyase family enzyme
MFSHVMVGANSIEVSHQFYDATFAALGYVTSFQDPMGRIFWLGPTGSFAITQPINGQPATSGNGMTIGFTCDSVEKVNAWHSAGIANGGTAVESPPGVRDSGTPLARYLAYLRDPAGNKLCAMYLIK